MEACRLEGRGDPVAKGKEWWKPGKMDLCIVNKGAEVCGEGSLAICSKSMVLL